MTDSNNLQVRDLLAHIGQTCKMIEDRLDGEPPAAAPSQPPRPPQPPKRRQGIKPVFKTPCKGCRASLSWQKTVHDEWVALDEEPGPYVVNGGIAHFRFGSDEGYRYHYGEDACPNNPHDKPKASPESKLLFDQMKEALERNRGCSEKEEGGA
jgi:hypothetical protein